LERGRGLERVGEGERGREGERAGEGEREGTFFQQNSLPTKFSSNKILFQQN
jgi:hypothetical protein